MFEWLKDKVDDFKYSDGFQKAKDIASIPLIIGEGLTELAAAPGEVINEIRVEKSIESGSNKWDSVKKVALYSRIMNFAIIDICNAGGTSQKIHFLSISDETRESLCIIKGCHHGFYASPDAAEWRLTWQNKGFTPLQRKAAVKSALNYGFISRDLAERFTNFFQVLHEVNKGVEIQTFLSKIVAGDEDFRALALALIPKYIKLD